jgi:DNA-directed RNA polymerase specialized sigma24 family protein
MGPYAGVDDADLAFQLYCAVLDRDNGTRDEVLQEIVRRHHRTVGAYLIKHFEQSLTREDREEVLWTSLQSLWQKIGEGSDFGKLGTFWCAIARNDAIDLIRRETAAKRGGDAGTLSLEEPTRDGQKIDAPVRDETRDGIYDRELTAALEAEIARLSPLEQDIVRTLIALSEAGKEMGHEHDERLAQHHGTKAKYVKLKRHEVRKHVEDALRKKGFDIPARRRRS